MSVVAVGISSFGSFINQPFAAFHNLKDAVAEALSRIFVVLGQGKNCIYVTAQLA